LVDGAQIGLAMVTGVPRPRWRPRRKRCGANPVSLAVEPLFFKVGRGVRRNPGDPERGGREEVVWGDVAGRLVTRHPLAPGLRACDVRSPRACCCRVETDGGRGGPDVWIGRSPLAGCKGAAPEVLLVLGRLALGRGTKIGCRARRGS